VSNLLTRCITLVLLGLGFLSVEVTAGLSELPDELLRQVAQYKGVARALIPVNRQFARFFSEEKFLLVKGMPSSCLLQYVYKKSFSAQLADLKAFGETRNNQKLFILMGTSSCGKSSLMKEFAKDNPSFIFLKTRELWKKMVLEHLRSNNRKAFDSLFEVFGDSLFGFLFCSLEENISLDNPIIRKKFTNINKDHLFLKKLQELQKHAKTYVEEHYLNFFLKRNFLIPEEVKKVLSLGRNVVLDNVPNKKDLSLFESMSPHLILVYCPFEDLSARIRTRNLEDDILEWRPILGVYEEFTTFFRAKEAKDNIKSVGVLSKAQLNYQIDIEFKAQLEEEKKMDSLQRRMRIITPIENLTAFKTKLLQNMGLDKAEEIELVPHHFRPNLIINTHYLSPQHSSILFQKYVNHIHK
jgi:hypothetical protein